jgi:membrane associated rhomboid family serine protease
MIFPIGDFPNVRGHVPIVTYLLIALNVAVYLWISVPLSAEPAPQGPLLAEYVRVLAERAQSPAELRAIVQRLTAYDLYVFANGFRPGSPSITDLFFSMFLHAGFLHLASNMLFLWIYGDNVEHRLGSLRFLLAYLATGVAATLFHAMSSPGSEVPMVGASGAISGVLGFYFVFFPKNQVRLLWLLPPFVMQVFTVPARTVLAIYLVLENLVPYLFSARDAGT